MDINARRETCTIIQFPRARRVPAAARREEQLASAASNRPVIDRDAWYHQAAIEDAERPRRP